MFMICRQIRIQIQIQIYALLQLYVFTHTNKHKIKEIKRKKKIMIEKNSKYFNNFNQKFIPKLQNKNNKGSYLNKLSDSINE